jgi:hypothetical protein
MIDLDPQTTAVLALFACAAAALLAAAVTVLALRVRHLSRPDRAHHARRVHDVAGDGRGHDPTLASLRADLLDVVHRTDELRDVVRSSVSKVGMVRYDAFEDMGGALSFSAALLDERGDGLVLSAINGRSETRCYAKPVVRGGSEHELSAEENAAIDTAVAGGGMGQVVPMTRRRRRTS